jgi:hypothetical protein
MAAASFWSTGTVRCRAQAAHAAMAAAFGMFMGAERARHRRIPRLPGTPSASPQQTWKLSSRVDELRLEAQQGPRDNRRNSGHPLLHDGSFCLRSPGIQGGS